MGRSNTGIESRPTGKKKKVAETCIILVDFQKKTEINYVCRSDYQSD